MGSLLSLFGGCRDPISHFRLKLCFHELLVKFWVKIIVVFSVQGILQVFQSFAKPLEMDDLPFTQKTDGRDHVRVVHQTQNIVIGGAGFLLCCTFGSVIWEVL